MNGPEIKQMMATRDTIARIYNDERFPTSHLNNLRMFAITTVWVCGVERLPQGKRWQWVADAMHLDNYRFWHLIGEDAPRYEPPGGYGAVSCCAPKARSDGQCGRSGQQSFRVTTDPTIGTWRFASFCSRHLDYAEHVRQAEQALTAAGTVPDPMPTTGGLLPCYITADWPELYAKARTSWKPPAVGICADDWPVMEQVAHAAPPKLLALDGGRAAEVAAGATSAAEDLQSGQDAPPMLRLIRDES